MVFPLKLSTTLAAYTMRKRLEGTNRFPYVLMLEPLFRCNLSCSGCGRIREYRDILEKTLSTEECLQAVRDAGAPVVSITGGEPLLHPEIDRIVEGIVKEGHFVNLCTNGLLLERSLEKFEPGVYLNFVLHMDGLAQTHDRIVGREGVFETALRGIASAKARGFRILVNTTVYRDSILDELKGLFELLNQVKVDGIMVSPAFSYEAVGGQILITREQARDFFNNLFTLNGHLPFYNTPMYRRFLAGERDLPCLPWSTPTRNPSGWKKPCYLITDGHCSSFEKLMEETDWEAYGPGRDPRCTHCMVHCGFEAGALERAGFKDLWSLIRWK
jgi:hopanoid biosynthesis associated radical SAM protein HpnH